jgi:hypothetical protein
MERSVDVHTPDSAVSRTWFRSGSISVQDIPLLVDLIISVFLDDLSVLVIKFALNTKYLLLFINNDTVVILEELVPKAVNSIRVQPGVSDIK